MAKKTENEVKETKKEAAVMDEAAKEKFQQKLKDLLALAKKKKNMLEYQEISDFFADMQLEAEQFDKILDFLEANNIDVLRITDDDSDDEILLDVDDEDEIEVEKIDLSVPDGVSIEDPVRMYLKEIGKVPLLSAEEEIELAKNMEAGAVAKEKIAILKSREENATEEELAEIKEEIKNLQKDLDAGDEAKKRLAEANLRLVVSIAKRYVGRGMLFLDLIQEGKITHWGISEANEDYLRRAHAVCPVTAVQNRYSMMARHYEPLFPILEELDVGLVAFSPMANGFLTGQYDKGQRFDAATDYRAAMPQFTDKAVDQNAALLKLLADMAAEKGATSAQISMAWMLCKHPWIVPIPGTRKEDRMKENAGAASVFLTPSEVRALDDALDHMDMSAVFGGTPLK